MIRISAPTTPTYRSGGSSVEGQSAAVSLSAASLSGRFRRPSSIPLTSAGDSGFTLVEILIVIALIAMIMSIAVPNLGMALKINLNNSAREVATVIRAAHDEAVLKGTVHRIAFDLEKQQYWVEVGDRNFLMRTSEKEEQERRLNDRRSEEEREKFKDPFSLATGVTKRKLNLSKGVKFKDLVTVRSREPVSAGIVYAHVFPHGFIEKLVIHLKDDFDRENTMIINSVTGKSRLLDKYVKEEL